jgi:hypothetical protein
LKNTRRSAGVNSSKLHVAEIRDEVEPDFTTAFLLRVLRPLAGLRFIGRNGIWFRGRTSSSRIISAGFRLICVLGLGIFVVRLPGA